MFFWPRCFLGSPITWSVSSQDCCAYAATIDFSQLHHVRVAPQGKRRNIASLPSSLSYVHGRVELPWPCTSSSTYVNPGRAYKLTLKSPFRAPQNSQARSGRCVRRPVSLAQDVQARARHPVRGWCRIRASMLPSSTAPQSRKPWSLASAQ